MFLYLFGNIAWYIHFPLFAVFTEFNFKNLFHYWWYLLFNLHNSFFKVIIYKNVLFPKINVFFNKTTYFQKFFWILTSRKFTKNLSPLICLCLLNCRSRELLWKRAVRKYLYPSLNISNSKQDVAFSVVMRACDVCFVIKKFWLVDHCSIHISKDYRNSGLPSLQKIAFPNILEVLHCVLALYITKSFWSAGRIQAASDFSGK